MKIAAGAGSRDLPVQGIQGDKRVPSWLSDQFGQGLEKDLQVGELTRSVDLGVRGENLFDEGCPRSWQSDNEGGSSIRVAPATGPGKELRGEGVDDPVDEDGILIGVVDMTPRGPRRGLQGVRGLKQFRSLGIKPLGVMNRRHTKVHQSAGVVRDVLLIPYLLHSLDIGSRHAILEVECQL